MRRSILSRRVWPAAIAILCGVLFQSIFHQGANWQTTGALSALAIVAAVHPLAGILLLAGLGPLSAVTGGLLQSWPLHFAEAMALACLTGAAAGRAWRGDTPPDWRLDAVAALLVAAALASAAVHTAVWLAEDLDLTVATVFRDFAIRTDPLTAAMQFAEGPLLVVIVAGACAAAGATTRVIRIMIWGAAGAASINIARLLGVWLRQPDGGLLDVLLNVRVNVQYGDLNAAGSYFAMVLVLVLGVMDRSVRWALPAATVLLLGLWVAGSRTALACVALVFVIRQAQSMRGRTVRQNARGLTAMALLGTIALAVWTVYPHYRNDRPLRAIGTRLAFATAGLEMAADYPLFGVGLGQFQARSTRYLPPLSGVTGGENAHNQFVQVLAELGVVGFLLTLALLALPLTSAARAARNGQASWTLAAAPATYLLTGLAGHPWLVPEAAYPFWIALGLAASTLPAAPEKASSSRRRAAILALALTAALIVVSLPLRISTARRAADLSNTTSGVSLWQHDPDRTRWRWAAGHAFFYVDASARTMHLPFRLQAGAAPVEVRISLDGVEADRVPVEPGQSWRMARLIIVRRAGSFVRVDVDVRDTAGRRITAAVSDSGGAVMIGQPIMDY